MQTTSPAPRRAYAALPIAWTLIMLWLTLTPSKNLPETPEWKFLSFDTAAHAGVFAVLAALSWFSLSRQRRWPALARRASLVVLVGCVVFGALIEVAQYAMHLGRNAEWTDLVGDSVGAALALLLVRGGWRWWQRRQLATPLLLVLLLLGSSLFFAPRAQAQAPDLTRARRTIEELASPKMHGRGYVQGGEHLAATYLRGRLRQLGVQPLVPDYTQPFGLDVNTFPGELSLKFNYGQGQLLARQFGEAGRDYIAAPASGGGNYRKLPVLLFDTTAFTNQASQQRLAAIALADRALLLTGRDAARFSTLPLPLQQHLNAAKVWLKCVPKLTGSLAGEQLQRVEIELLTPLVYKPEQVSSHGTAIPAFPNETVDIQLDAQLLRNYQTQNLAAVVRGKIQPDSFLVVSAHYDHLGMMGRATYFPGANDNASGVALLLELAAHYARPENQPACSVVFLLFGAEEAGLVGSRYFVAHPLVPLPRIKFLVNLDLLGTGEEGATVVNGRVFAPAYQRLTALNDAHHYLSRLTARGRAANSDHFPFSEAGVPAFFLYTRGGSTAYHDVNDQPAALSLAGFAGAFGLVRDFLDGQMGRQP
ncbi:MAG TPA: VanZ family protein [Hymenobacter sp.]|uniref:VanZ family protein n=1 Tax=Hymenobacter sp. TaxID=1898978 RepID=UPI002D805FBD|nr:VanZ family protein [Hymenobacter sp.]HET9505873.1 VanZ family protein [Hymenobacter sp.]